MNYFIEQKVFFFSIITYPNPYIGLITVFILNLTHSSLYVILIILVHLFF